MCRMQSPRFKLRPAEQVNPSSQQALFSKAPGPVAHLLVSFVGKFLATCHIDVG
jgi:hypothetical protein